MNLKYSKKSGDALRKLPAADRIAVVPIIEMFQENPVDSSLRNHALMGRMSGKRAVVVDHDLRIIFTERGNYKDVTLLDVGSHSEVYRR